MSDSKGQAALACDSPLKPDNGSHFITQRLPPQSTPTQVTFCKTKSDTLGKARQVHSPSVNLKKIKNQQVVESIHLLRDPLIVITGHSIIEFYSQNS